MHRADCLANLYMYFLCDTQNQGLSWPVYMMLVHLLPDTRTSAMTSRIAIFVNVRTELYS